MENDKSAVLLSLRPEAEWEDSLSRADDQSISALLHRIGRQRGSFRDFNEAILLEELAASKNPDVEPPVVVPELDREAREKEFSGDLEIVKAEEGQEETRERPEQSLADADVREKVLQLIAGALNEAALALDFTSLLLSSSRQTAVQSMSPALKDAVPVGALSHVRLRNAHAAREAVPTSTILGFRAQGLSNASRALRRANTATLDSHATDEVFWRELQALKADKWQVFRPRPDATGLAVKYGPGTRHFVHLEKDPNGHIDTSKFDSTLVSLRLSVRQENKCIATHKETPFPKSTSGLGIIHYLERARRSLLNSSIFDDLVKEARGNAHLGLSVVDQVITIPVDDSREICVELREVSDDDDNVESDADVTDRDVDMTDDETRGTEDIILRTLATMIYSRYTGYPRAHPLRTLMSVYRHGNLAATLQRSSQLVLDGLQSLTWLGSLQATMAHDSSNGEWHSAAETNLKLTVLSSRLHIVITTSLQLVTTYSINSSCAPTTGVLFAERHQSTDDPEEVSGLIQRETLQALMHYVAQASPSIEAGFDNEMQLSDGRILTIGLTRTGKIRVQNSSGDCKFIQENLVAEMLDLDGYKTA